MLYHHTVSQLAVLCAAMALCERKVDGDTPIPVDIEECRNNFRNLRTKSASARSAN